MSLEDDDDDDAVVLDLMLFSSLLFLLSLQCLSDGRCPDGGN